MVIKLIGAFLAEIGFGILFNIHGQKLWAAALTGTLGSLIYELVMQVRGGEVLAMFLAACGLCRIVRPSCGLRRIGRTPSKQRLFRRQRKSGLWNHRHEQSKRQKQTQCAPKQNPHPLSAKS